MHDGHRERLRQRYRQTGLDGFADHEVLEFLLTFAIPRANTNPPGHSLLEQFGSLSGVLSAQEGELNQVAGIGPKAALLLQLCGDVMRRVQLQEAAGKQARPALRNPEAAARYAMELTRGQRYECVYVVGLDKNRKVLQANRLVQGTLTETPLYPRNVVETALMQQAHSVMLVHNHPSGDPRPSAADIAVTQTIQQALGCIDIQLFDHLIVGGRLVYSFTMGTALSFYQKEALAILPGELEHLGCRLNPLPQVPGLAAEEPQPNTPIKEEHP